MYNLLVVIAAIGMASAAQDCLVRDVGGTLDTTLKTPFVFKSRVVLNVFYGEDESLSNSSPGFEVHLRNGEKIFVLVFTDYTLQVLEKGQTSRELGEVRFPLPGRGGLWQVIYLALSGGWLTVIDPALPDLVYQRHLGATSEATHLTVSSKWPLALAFNCEAGCPIVTSPSLVTRRLEVASVKNLYVFPLTSQYIVTLEVTLEVEKDIEKRRLEVHQGGIARVREWNKVQVILSTGNNETILNLEVNGELAASDRIQGWTESSFVTLLELKNAKFAPYCRPVDVQTAMSGTIPVWNCSWNLASGLITVSILLFILLLITCCLLCWSRKKNPTVSSGASHNVTRGPHPLREKKVTSYHHYEEVERFRPQAFFRGQPSSPLKEESSCDVPEVDLAIGGEKLYQNLPVFDKP